jgi:hypothetical protein
MKKNKKVLLKEKEILEEDLKGINFERHELIKVYAVGLKFVGVNFRQSIIDGCYFRRCIFRDCDFTGANIIRTNFQGTDFIGCTFDYTTFSGTQIGITPLSKNLPSWENLKMQLAKNLRLNYASIGDYEGVNFAIKVELSATLEHLRKAAFSRESYYRGKKEYSGMGRIRHVFKFMWHFMWHLGFDLLWGNGEKPIRMLISIPLMLVAMALIFTVSVDMSILDSVKETAHVFFIGGASIKIGLWSSAVINIFRYVVIGLFVSSLVRRLSRR